MKYFLILFSQLYLFSITSTVATHNDDQVKYFKRETKGYPVAYRKQIGTDYTVEECAEDCNSYYAGNEFYMAYCPYDKQTEMTETECASYAAAANLNGGLYYTSHKATNSKENPFGCIFSGDLINGAKTNIFFNINKENTAGTFNSDWNGIICNSVASGYTPFNKNPDGFDDQMPPCIEKHDKCNICVCTTKAGLPWSPAQISNNQYQTYSICQECGHGYYTVSTCNAQADTVCRAYGGSCDGGDLISPTSSRTQDNQCGSCNLGYHLSDTSSCEENTCTCATGTGATGTACTSNGANICTSCNDGYKLSGTSCQAYAGNCANGVLEAQSSRTQDNHCGTCNTGFYIAQNFFGVPTCTSHVCKCFNGVKATGTSCTSGTNFFNANICASCYAGHEKKDYFQSSFVGVQPSTWNSCVQWEGNCANGELIAESSRTQINHCGTCDIGFGKNWSSHQCEQCTVDDVQYSNSSDNSACIDHEKCGLGVGSNYNTILDKVRSPSQCTECVAGTFSNSTLYGPCDTCSTEKYQSEAGAIQCEACITCSAAEHETTPCSATVDRECTPNVCTCQNGTSATSFDCTADNTNICTSCNNGYYKDGNSCEPYTGACTDGELIEQLLRTAHHECGTCNLGYHLGSGTESRKCVAYTGNCANGELIAQSSRTQNNHCGTCYSGYQPHNTICTILGCTDITMKNYDDTALIDDGTCQDWDHGICSTICSSEGCMNPSFASYDSTYEVHDQADCVGPTSDCPTLKDKWNVACNCTNRDSITCNNIKSVYSRYNCYASHSMADGSVMCGATHDAIGGATHTISYSLLNQDHCTNVISSLSQCKEAATVLDLYFERVSDNANGTPGCAHHKGNVYYNTNLNAARACSGEDTCICIDYDTPTIVSYSLLGSLLNFDHCTNVISSQAACEAAATVLDLIFLRVGSWSSPPGCITDKGKVRYNTNLTSAGACGFNGNQCICID